MLIWKRERYAVDNWVLRGLIREVMHTLIVYQEDLSHFEDGDQDEDENDELCILSLFTQMINWTPEKVMMKLANK